MKEKLHLQRVSVSFCLLMMHNKKKYIGKFKLYINHIV